ncbi:MAG: deoxyribodipyrimidine photo-lyase [Bacteriovoracaceae bacterium]
MKKISVVWFRRDLRLTDHVALFNALSENEAVLPVFIFNQDQLKNLESPEDKRVTFIFTQIERLKTELQKIGSDIHVEFGTVLECWKKIVKTYRIESVYFNHDYEPREIKRDKAIIKFLKSVGIGCKTFKDHVIFEKNEILNNSNRPYTVFTHYKNRWLELLTDEHLKNYDTKLFKKNFYKIKSLPLLSLEEMGFIRVKLIVKAPKLDLDKLETYQKKRDRPDLDATSKMSIHLRFGTISVRELVRKAYDISSTWISEIIWRDFFSQLIFHFPYTVTREFNPKFQNITWINNKNDFKLWCEGRTGFPLVDAGMRELNETGLMHNRVRMVTASFLVKNLLIDWRLGEKYFAEKLLDYDMASNIGNWQWVAGTGVDAAPYFRVFNPLIQQKKFDPDNLYCKKWIEEFETNTYQNFKMIDYKLSYNRVLAVYQESANLYSQLNDN